MEAFRVLLTDPKLNAPTFARFLEPYLPLIKSRTLNMLYTSLYRSQGDYEQYLPDLIKESAMDDRLHRLLFSLPMSYRLSPLYSSISLPLVSPS